MARPRILLPVMQALLGLVLLAWLPAIDHANSGASFLIQVEEALSLSGLSDGGEGDGEACPDTWKDGTGGPDAVLAWDLSCRSRGRAGQGVRLDSPQSGNAALLGSLRATGPPRP
ncbi:hypothetical protein [Microvirga mediterraneensis]|uniref:Uncharacterized protein n=1 Tax=Microvirga mediterraneensis TaxID=2754695 RepID=A0A838BJ23_9HYPH|nr:hypothetical protein [Microvirga mediterraneensis]MBA1155508.1 hypothetical protein [Microvirga mediterraneensis]